MSKEGTQILEKEEVDTELEEPKMYHVMLINDDFTPMDFVVYLLMEVFHKNSEDAWITTNEVHENGSGIAGTYIKDIAETKSSLSNKLAKANGFPLETKIEEA